MKLPLSEHEHEFSVIDADGAIILSASGMHIDQFGEVAPALIATCNRHEELAKRLAWAVRFIETYAAEFTGPATPEMKKCREVLAAAGRA